MESIMKFHVYLFSGWYVQHSQLQNPKKVMAGFKHAKPGHFNGRTSPSLHDLTVSGLRQPWKIPMLLKKICSSLIGGLPHDFFPRVYRYIPGGLDPEKLRMKEACSTDFILLITLKIHSLKGLIPKKNPDPRHCDGLSQITQNAMGTHVSLIFLGVVITHIFRAQNHHFSMFFWGPKVVSNHFLDDVSHPKVSSLHQDLP